MKEPLLGTTLSLQALPAADSEHLLIRNRQLSALADLGQSAIRARDLQALLDEAVLCIAATLGIESVAIAERLPDSETLRIVAAVGTPLDLAASRDAHGVAEIDVTAGGRSRRWGALITEPAAPDHRGFLRSVANVLALGIERHELEIAQQRQSDVLQTVFDTIPVMISLWRPEVGFAGANREWERVLGWTVAEAQQTDILAQTYPDPAARSRAQEFIRRAERRWEDFQVHTRDGRVIETSWARFAMADGLSIGFGVDNTDRYRAAAALRESEVRFARLFQASPVALGMSTVAEGRIRDVNESWLELFGYRREEVIGRTNVELALTIEPGVREAMVQLIRKEHVLRSQEIKVRTKSGETRDLLVTAVYVDLPDEEDMWLSAQVDITDRKRAEAERDRLLESERTTRAEAEAARDRLAVIQRITEPAAGYLVLEQLLHEMLSRLRDALDADSASVMLIDEDRRMLYPLAVAGLPLSHIASLRVPLGKSVSGRIASEGRALIVDDYSTVDVSGIEGMPPEELTAMAHAGMGAPLRIGDKVVGVVGVSSGHARRFTQDELQLLLLVADRVGPAIERGRLAETVRVGGERLKALSTRLLTAQEEERRRLAIELHDELGQALTAAKINLETVERASGNGSGSHHLRNAIASVDQAMERVRNIALDLRPSVLDDLGLPAALRWYGDRFAREMKVEAHFSVDTIPKLESELEISCFRVAQEALTNVARHARADNVWLDLHAASTGLVLHVRDDGVGFDVASMRTRAIGGASLGLLGMEERVSLLGGAFEVTSVEGEGTDVYACFPIMESATS
jgi:PAS domain S-box-containing protein